MKQVIGVSAAFLIACNALANDMPDTTAKALAAGEPAAVIKALDKAFYRGNIVAAQKDAEQVREAARHKLAPPQLKSAHELVDNWAPKRS